MAIRKKRKYRPIHPSIRDALGYKDSESDEEVYADWKERTSRVCKPCWELKYCPYGPLVEKSPTIPALKEGMQEQIEYFQECIKTKLVGGITTLTPELRAQLEEWSQDEQIVLRQAFTELTNRRRLEAASELKTDDEKIAAWIGREMPPIHVYRAAFQEDDNDLREDQFPLEDWKQIIQIADEIQRRDAQALRTGLLDNRSPLEPARRAWFKRSIKNFHPEDYPDEVPKVFQEAECNVFGHVCPVFFAAESMTETADTRRIGRKTPNFPTMMRIVRRDDYRCQHCQKNFKITKLNLTTLFPCRKGEAQKSIIYG